MQRIIFADRIAAPAAAGNKAFRLAQLRQAGFEVPDFFVVSAAADSADRDAGRVAADRTPGGTVPAAEGPR